MTVGIFAGGGPFRSQRGISQQKGNFAGGFTTHFAAAKWTLEAVKWHMCAWGWFCGYENFGRGVLWLRNFALEGFIVHFAVAKWAFGLRIGTGVPKDGFAAAKIFTGGVLWLRNCFVGGPYFRRGTLFSQGSSFGCESFLQGDPLFVG